MIQVQEGNIYSFKMNSGEELIGKVTKIEDDCYIVDSPLSTGMTQQGMQLMPAMFTIELNAEVIISMDSVAIVGNPREDVADAYRESTTGIKVPKKQIIMS